jgi:nicotinamidase-related amidase
MNKPYVRLDKNNAAVLLVDHQAGLLSLVRDIDPDTFRNNVLVLADLAKYFKLPTILTTSFEDGPNGPLMTELITHTGGSYCAPILCFTAKRFPTTYVSIPRDLRNSSTTPDHTL